VLAAVGAFASTNVDDMLLLIAWFADRRMQARHVVLGRYLGIGALLAVSELGALVGEALNVPTRFLGLLPIALGVRRLLQLRRARDETQMPPGQAIGAVVALTIANGGDNIAV
jgi:cadmium resistance protein CadD (predicted permease)